MGLIDKLTQERCPVCKAVLSAEKTNILWSHVIKSCPHGHYRKEFIPSLESYIELK